MTAKYIVVEGTEGCFKTTNTQALADYLIAQGFKVLVTKEPGTSHIPLTNQLRAFMLDKQYDDVLTRPARELISQAIRSIHLEKLIVPALTQYDYIIQDRGLLSGLAYGMACGNTQREIDNLITYIMPRPFPIDWNIYDNIVFLKGDTEAGLKRALASKQEFETGDAIEAKGISFMREVEYNFYHILEQAPNSVVVDVTGKNREEVLSEILKGIGVYGK